MNSEKNSNTAIIAQLLRERFMRGGPYAILTWSVSDWYAFMAALPKVCHTSGGFKKTPNPKSQPAPVNQRNDKWLDRRQELNRRWPLTLYCYTQVLRRVHAVQQPTELGRQTMCSISTIFLCQLSIFSFFPWNQFGLWHRILIKFYLKDISLSKAYILFRELVNKTEII